MRMKARGDVNTWMRGDDSQGSWLDRGSLLEIGGVGGGRDSLQQICEH